MLTMLIPWEHTIETWGGEFNLKKLYFYKNFWFWVALSLLIYILRQSEVLGVEVLVNIIVYVYKQVISEPIVFLAFLISIITVYIERINVLRISPLKTKNTQSLQIPLYQHFRKWYFHKIGMKAINLDEIDTN